MKMPGLGNFCLSVSGNGAAVLARPRPLCRNDVKIVCVVQLLDMREWGRELSREYVLWRSPVVDSEEVVKRSVFIVFFVAINEGIFSMRAIVHVLARAVGAGTCPSASLSGVCLNQQLARLCIARLLLFRAAEVKSAIQDRSHRGLSCAVVIARSVQPPASLLSALGKGRIVNAAGDTCLTPH